MKTRFLFVISGLGLGLLYYFGSMVVGLFDFGCSESYSAGLCDVVSVLGVIFYPVKIIYSLVGNRTDMTFILILALFAILGLILGVVLKRKEKALYTY